MAAERAEAERLDREKQTVEERAKVERLGKEKLAAEEATQRAEVELATKQVELDRLEQERSDLKMALAEQQRVDALLIRIAVPVGTIDLATVEEGAVNPSPTAVVSPFMLKFHPRGLHKNTCFSFPTC